MVAPGKLEDSKKQAPVVRSGHFPWDLCFPETPSASLTGKWRDAAVTLFAIYNVFACRNLRHD